TQPGAVTYGTVLNPQPALRSQDQFGNISTTGLPATRNVTLTLSAGTGALQGSTNADIGTSAGNGVVTFTNIQVSAAGSGKQITASASSMTNAVSASFAINQVTVTGSITASSKTYDGTSAATIATRSLTGVLGSD